MTRNQIIANTLRWCNAQRKKQDKKPLAKLPKGKRRNPLSCPCGKATGLYVYKSVASKFATGRCHVPLPNSVREFVQMFDAGEIPEYEE